MASKFGNIIIGKSTGQRIAFDGDITGDIIWVGIKKDPDQDYYDLFEYATLDPPDPVTGKIVAAVWQLTASQTSQLSPGRYYAEVVHQTPDGEHRSSLLDGPQRFVAIQGV